jgi:hypothetical protein
MEQFKEAQELSEKELEQIIFLSYMFSQGSLTLQASLVHAIAKITGHQDQEFAKKAFDSFATSLQFKPDTGFSITRAHIHSENVDDPKDHFGDVSHLSHQETSRTVVDFSEIVNDIWERDYFYLYEKNGRPNRNHDDFKENTIQDPYFSFGVAYLLNDTTTPSPVFNKLLERLRQYEVDESIKPQKEAVIQIYKEHHPDQSNYNL